MKVFHLITHFDLGGAERVAASIAESDTDGMEYHIVEIMRGRSAYSRRFLAELRGKGIRCHRSLIPDIRWHFAVERIAALLFPLRLLYIVLRWRPDVIHTHTETPDLALFAAWRLCPWLLRRVRIVRTIHNTRLWTGLDRLCRPVEAMFCRLGANRAISLSTQSAYAERFGQTPPVIYNGVRPTPQKPYPNLPPGRTHILFAGRLEPQKGVDRLCGTLRECAATGRYHFTIAGDGSMRPDVERTLLELGGRRLADGTVTCATATLTGPIFALDSRMASFDYLYMPSRHEGLSMLSLEACINGLPVVASQVSGLSDTLPPDWPLLAPGGDPESFSHIFSDTLPAAHHDELAARARAFVWERFGIRQMQLAYEQTYREK